MECNLRGAEVSLAVADPQRTYAVVVGIELYRAGSTWDLNGPAVDARLFADWLRSWHVPEEQIKLLLAVNEEDPKKKALLAGSPRALPASRDEVRQALNWLHAQAGDLLVLFWGGHGILGDEKNRRLFYPDATTDDKQNLDLDELLVSLRTTYFAGFPLQICIIDACANYVEDLQLAYKLPKDSLPSGDPLSPEPGQFVLLAGRAGEVAENLGAEGRGQFSKVVLEELADEPNWLPDMDALKARVWQRFEALREQEKSSQTPIYRYHRDWGGSEQLLQDMQSLRAVFFERFARVTRDDRGQVVAAAGGLLGAADLKALYLRSLPPHTTINTSAKTLEEILFDLANLSSQVGGAFPAPLLEFVERLALQVEKGEPAVASRLRSWVDQKAPQLVVQPSEIELLRSRLRGGFEAQGAHAYVLVEVAQDRWEAEMFSLRAWSCVEACRPIDLPPGVPDPQPRPLQEIQAILTQLLESPYPHVPEGAELTIEVFLPRRLLCWDIDQWVIQAGKVLKTPVGIQHRIVVRWLERPLERAAAAAWSRKWNSFRSTNLPLADSIFWLRSRQQLNLETLYLELSDRSDRFCLGLAFSPPEAPEAEDILNMALDAGMPIAFWLRQCRDDPQRVEQDILKALEGVHVTELPEAVRQTRRQAFKAKEKDHVGNHLTLLWDDACRKLPGSDKPFVRPRLEGGNT